MADTEHTSPRVRPCGRAWWAWVLGINLAWPLLLSALIQLGPLADSVYRMPAEITCVLLIFTANQIAARFIGGALWIWLLSVLNVGAYALAGGMAFILALPRVVELL
ncbi:hypothetical protein J4E08_07620 [Sagittula sp. NFXS13]|uniref:hypothetical protein n=1 Tax=Sagittula sp. NFXS13 TaxID=2819095 RepID=UPI0032E03EA9